MRLSKRTARVAGPVLAVVLLTAVVWPSMVFAGADDFVIKPVSPKDLKESIARHLPDLT